MTSLRAVVPLLTLALLGQGCVTRVKLRSSSTTFVTLEQATAHFERTPPEVFAALQPEMFGRGYLLTQQVEGAPGSKFYLFKGSRKSPPVAVAAEQKPPPRYELGSWFAVKVSLNEKGTGSDVTMFGKPTVDGQEVCSDADSLLAEAHYWCEDTQVRPESPDLKVVAGREEADTVRGALASLQAKLAAPAPAPTPAPGTEPTPPTPPAPPPPLPAP